jgi:hypothetical protein
MKALGFSPPVLRRSLLAVWFSTIAAPRFASACSVCFGNPESSLVDGAVAGVWFLAGVVGFVLFGVIGTGFFWLHRDRTLHRPSSAPSESTRHE